MNEDMSLRKKDLKTFSHFDERSTSQWGWLTYHKDNKTLMSSDVNTTLYDSGGS